MIHTDEKTHLFDKPVIVGLDVNVDGGMRESIKDVPEKRDAFVLSSLTETLCRDKDKSHKQPAAVCVSSFLLKTHI